MAETCTGACSSNCTTTCSGYCSGCGGACSRSCTHACDKVCADTCSASCKDGCKNSCDGCDTGCSGECWKTCQTECEDECAKGCQYRCEAGQTISSNPKTQHLTFNWSTTLCSGQYVNIKATDWNTLGTNIKSAVSFCGGVATNAKNDVDPNDYITGDIYNSYITALNSVAGLTNTKDALATVSHGPNGKYLEPEDFTKLATTLNDATINDKSCCELSEYCVEHCNESQGPSGRGGTS